MTTPATKIVAALFLAVQWWCTELQSGYQNADVYALLDCSLGDTQLALQNNCLVQQ